jgi:hypothetical protein
VLCAFDLLELDGEDLRRTPIETRKLTLKSLLRGKHAGITFNEHFDAEGAIVYRQACALGCEGIVSKRLGSPYRSGRTDHWVKVKNPEASAVTRARPRKIGADDFCLFAGAAAPRTMRADSPAPSQPWVAVVARTAPRLRDYPFFENRIAVRFATNGMRTVAPARSPRNSRHLNFASPCLDLIVLGAGARLRYLRRLGFGDDDWARSRLFDHIDDASFDRRDAWRLHRFPSPGNLLCLSALRFSLSQRFSLLRRGYDPLRRSSSRGLGGLARLTARCRFSSPCCRSLLPLSHDPRLFPGRQNYVAFSIG